MFDVAVIGLGAMGSAAASALARRGKRVVGLERFEPEHNRGSSHGESRAFRLAHFEGAHYSALARHALSLWRDLEATTGEEVLLETGVLECGSKDSGIVKKSIEAAIRTASRTKCWTAARSQRDFPPSTCLTGGAACFRRKADCSVRSAPSAPSFALRRVPARISGSTRASAAWSPVPEPSRS